MEIARALPWRKRARESAKNQLEQRDRAKTKTVKQVQKSITMNRLRAKGESFALRYYVHMYYVLTYDRVCVHKARAALHSVPRYGDNASNP